MRLAEKLSFPGMNRNPQFLSLGAESTMFLLSLSPKSRSQAEPFNEHLIKSPKLEPPSLLGRCLNQFML